MSEKRRPRACDTCHSIKIKCELGSSEGTPPCARCLRLGKECIVSVPKRQKDRVAELEAQVEALTRQLRTQKIQPDLSPTESSVPTPELDGQTASRSRAGTGYAGQKKRRIDEELTPPLSDNDGGVERNERVALDTVLPQHVQQDLLARYLRELVPYFPVVPIAGDQSYEGLRRKRPLLLQAALYCASFGSLSLDKQEDVGKLVMDLFAEKAMGEGEKSAELVQAIQAVVLYYRTTKHHTHITVWQFIQLAGGLAADIGIGGPQRPPSLDCPTGGPYIDSSEAWRTWLVCHMLSATLALFTRKPNASNWDQRDENNLQMLEYSYFRMDTDELLSQHVRAERLCDTIATKQCLYDDAPTVDVMESAVQTEMRRLQNTITDWRLQLPARINGPVMHFWWIVAELYMHEPVLHTATNKASFAAPFIAPRISVTDFPNPIVSSEHIVSLCKIRDNVHALCDVFGGLSIGHLIALPAMYFPGRIAYAIFILAKLYVAITAPGNTFGAFIDPESLQVDLYLEKMVQAHNKIAAVDEWCGQARILSSSFRMREWYQNYRSNFLHLAPKDSQVNAELAVPSFASLPTSTAPLPTDWNTLDYIDSTQDLGFDEFFADPLPDHSFPQHFDGLSTMPANSLSQSFV